jgi:hypothetical protein
MAVLAGVLINHVAATTPASCEVDEDDLCTVDYESCSTDEDDLCSSVCDYEDGDLCDASDYPTTGGGGGGSGGTGVTSTAAPVTTVALCDTDEMDLCDSTGSGYTTYAPGDAPTTPQTHTRTGSFTVTVAATVYQTQSAAIKTWATKLVHHGTASTFTEAQGYVSAEVTTVSGRRLSQMARWLTTSTHSVAWTITVPSNKASSLASTIVLVQSNTTDFENVMVQQYQAAGVAVTSLSISSFVAGNYFESDTAFARRMADSFSLAMLALLSFSCFAAFH